jgi:hypothetical protein
MDWVRRLSPALFGVALVLMLHGDMVLALLCAVLFFVVYVGASWNTPPARRRRRRRPAADEEA